MKKMIIIALLITASFLLGAYSRDNSKEYPTCGIIVDVNYDTDVATFEDFNGFQWSFYGVEDWMTGDIIAVIMNDNNTETIFDDKIVDYKYCGYIDNEN